MSARRTRFRTPMVDFASNTLATLQRLVRGGRRASSPRTGVQWLGDELACARLADDNDHAVALAACLHASGARRDAVRAWRDEGVLRGSLVLALTPGQYEVQYVVAPDVPADEMREALRWQLAPTLSYPPEEAVLDFAPLPSKAQAAGGSKAMLIVAAAQRQAIDESLAPFLEAGIVIAAVDLPEFAQRNLACWADAAPAAPDTTAWLGFDRDTCLLTIQHEGALAFSRRMLLPGAAVRAIDADLAPAAMHFAERVVTQVQRSLELFERQSGLPPLARVTVGPHMHAPTIARLLSERASLQAEVLDVDAHLSAGRAADPVQSAGEPAAAVMTALGAALRETTAASRSRRRPTAARVA